MICYYIAYLWYENRIFTNQYITTTKTIILQSNGNKKICINPYTHANNKIYMNLSAVIKIDNRNKGNSYEWFFGRFGFCEYIKSEYMCFMDTYTTMNDEGLYHMIKYMDKHPKCGFTSGIHNILTINITNIFILILI